MNLSRLWLLSFVLTACSADRCDHYYANLDTYEPPSQTYRLRYLSPPWEIEGEPGESIALRINRTQILEVDADVPSKYRVVVGIDAAITAAARIDAEKAAALERGEQIIGTELAVTTDSGNTGVQLFSQKMSEFGTRSYRYVAFDAPLGSVHMFFEGDPDLDNAEVDAMVRVFSVRTTALAEMP